MDQSSLKAKTLAIMLILFLSSPIREVVAKHLVGEKLPSGKDPFFCHGFSTQLPAFFLGKYRERDKAEYANLRSSRARCH